MSSVRGLVLHSDLSQEPINAPSLAPIRKQKSDPEPQPPTAFSKKRKGGMGGYGAARI